MSLLLLTCCSVVCGVRACLYTLPFCRHRHIDWEDAPGFATSRGSRLLTASYEPGDIVLFSQFMLHGSFDGNSATGAARMSVDLRWHAKHNGGHDERYDSYCISSYLHHARISYTIILCYLACITPVPWGPVKISEGYTGSCTKIIDSCGARQNPYVCFRYESNIIAIYGGITG